MAEHTEIVIFGPLPPPYGGVAIFDTLLGLGFKQQDIRYRNFSDESLDGISALKPRSVILDSFSYSLEFPEGRKILKCLFAKIRKKLFWIKVVHNGSLPERYKSYSWKQRMLFRISLYLFDRIVVVNDALREWLVSDIKVRKPIQVIASLLPIPVDYIGTDDSSVHDKRAERKVVSSIGVFTRDYGFKDIADVIQMLRDETGVGIGFVIVDPGFTNDREYEESLLEGRDWIEVHRQMPHPDTMRILRDSDVFVRAFYYESYGLSRVEALLCGTRVIATNMGETRGMTLFEPGDISVLKELLHDALFKPDETDSQSLSRMFREEAEANLRKLIELTGS